MKLKSCYCRGSEGKEWKGKVKKKILIEFHAGRVVTIGN
jgi:hypothetical protein